MPIYAYRCEACGFQKDVLQKLSDAPLTECPSCHAAGFRKQVTAAGFQLKGSGWYATDFRNNGAAPAAAPPKEAGTAAPAAPAAAPASPAATPSGGESSGKPSASARASCAPGCGCH